MSLKNLKLPKPDAVRTVTNYRKSISKQPVSDKLRAALKNGKKKELENLNKKVAASDSTPPIDMES